MKYQNPEPSLFICNRSSFVDQIEPNSLAIFNSNDEFPRSGDAHFPFKQNADLFYLCGIDQEQTVLLLFPDSPNPRYREILCLRETNEHIAVWEGNKLSKEEASRISGISKEGILWVSEFDAVLTVCMHYVQYVYLNTNENDRYLPIVPYRDLRFIQILRENYPLHDYKRAAPILRGLRQKKKKEELTLIRQAITITSKAFNRVARFLRPGVSEFEIEAEVIHEFIKSRATGHAYNPIIASGSNSCVLHYNDNDRTCEDGDVVLMDFGAEYGNYNADLTRTLPVNGRFSDRQRQVYEAVVRIMDQAKVMLRPGLLLDEYRLETDLIAEAELLDLGLIRPNELGTGLKPGTAFRKFYPHGISHFLGLDVHDIGDRFTRLEEGMVLTVEPGIYVRNENLGIRLENDVYITAQSNEDLMEGVTIAADAIEDLMNMKPQS